MRHRIHLLALGVAFLVGLLLAHSASVRAQPPRTDIPVQLLTAATTGSGTLDRTTIPNCRETAVYIQWGAGTNAGGVTVESAHDIGYTGTWAPLTTVAWSAASKEDIVQITGVHVSLRARISTMVTGGSINVFAICN